MGTFTSLAMIAIIAPAMIPFSNHSRHHAPASTATTANHNQLSEITGWFQPAVGYDQPQPQQQYPSSWDWALDGALQWWLVAVLGAQLVQVPMRISLHGALAADFSALQRDQVVARLMALVTSVAWRANKVAGNVSYALFFVGCFLASFTQHLSTYHSLSNSDSGDSGYLPSATSMRLGRASFSPQNFESWDDYEVEASHHLASAEASAASSYNNRLLWTATACLVALAARIV